MSKGLRFAAGALGVSLLLCSCAPVLSKAYMREGERSVSFASLRENPGQHRGRLFILGGVIVGAKFTEAGSQVEAMQVPVDRYGYFRDRGRSEGRYLALLPKEQGIMDPVVFRRGRRITLAGEFVEIRKGKIDEMEYGYPVFRIKEIYLWPRERYYPPLYYYDPWFYPYPYFYGAAWWQYYSFPGPAQQPVFRPRTPSSGQPSQNQPPPSPPSRGREDRDRELR